MKTGKCNNINIMEFKTVEGNSDTGLIFWLWLMSFHLYEVFYSFHLRKCPFEIL